MGRLLARSLRLSRNHKSGHAPESMLLVNPHELYVQNLCHLPYKMSSTATTAPVLNMLGMAEHNLRDQRHTMYMASPESDSSSSEVIQALEIARESPDGARDPTISSILESALANIWGKVQAHPDSYIMSRDEFAIFNLFQHRFLDDRLATAARKRFWDNSTLP
ncbi:hypothetical protein GGR57DRAFT_400264 [Xylariaceae sp. FL1272]|nr:hypothetical protein GGR57DRAFT_400264 [Xylariaceae sp. FL1272]